MATSNKRLELVFILDNKNTMTVSVSNPQSDLTLAKAQAVAEKLFPVLMSNAGAAAVSLKSARLSESTVTELE